MGDERRDIYLDHNATAPVHPEVLHALTPFLSGCYGNPSAPYVAGQRARLAVEETRGRVARLIGAPAGSLVFTSGGTESSNLALKGAHFSRVLQKPGHIVISAIEHPCVRVTAQWLKRHGVGVTVVPADRSGRVSAGAVGTALRPDTFLVSVMHANNETGVIQPIRSIADVVRSHGALFHVDGVQAAGKIPVDVEQLGCDFYALSAHKFGGLKGAGALYVRDRDGLEWIQQGGHQEGGLRAGTENTPGIFAMGKAAEIALRDLEATGRHCLAVRDVFERLAQDVPMTRINGHPTERLPNTVNLCCLYADAMSVVVAMSVEGVSIGTGSACASHVKEPSRVLLAMGLSEMAAYCSVRISTGPGVTVAEAQFAAAKLKTTVENVRLVTAPEDIGVCDEDCPCFVEAGDA